MTKPKIGQWIVWYTGTSYERNTGLFVADLGDAGCLVSIAPSGRGEDDFTGRPVIHLRFRRAEDLEFDRD